MATINPTAKDILIGNAVYVWSAMANGDVGAPAGITGSGDRSAQVSGTFGAGGQVIIEGSLDLVNWFTLRDPSGVNLSFTSAGLRAVLENVVGLRPRVTSGDGSTALDVVVVTRRDRNG